VFVAISIPADVEVELGEFVDPLREARPDLRWTKPSTWHLTLQFLGECGPREVDRQIERWRGRAERCRPFELRLAGAGTFPAASWMASALWVGISGDVEAFGRIAMPDQLPHLTLARARRPTDLVAAVGELAPFESSPFHVTEIQVMESHLRSKGERGPRYEVLETIALGASHVPGGGVRDPAHDPRGRRP
jgi:2'-5' RNA ligase